MTMYIQTQKGNLPAEYEWTQQFTVYRENIWWNKQHPKFHIGYIKDHACRHKSMAASC